MRSYRIMKFRSNNFAKKLWLNSQAKSTKASRIQGAGHAWSEITHAQDTRCAAADGGRHVEPQYRVEPVDRGDDGRRFSAAGAIGRHVLAAARGHDRCGAGGAAVSGLDGAGRDQGTTAAARLADDPSRAAPEGRDASHCVNHFTLRRRPPRYCSACEG